MSPTCEPGLHVVIIGAGPAGLAAGVCLQRRKIPYTILERGDAPLCSWRQIDPDALMVSPTRMTLLPDMTLGNHQSAYSTFRDFTSILERYQRDHDIEVRSKSEVVDVSRKDDAFEIAYKDGDGNIRKINATHVVNATGILTHRQLPERFSAHECTVPWKHSLDVRRHHLEAAQRLLVVGKRVSAGEILDRWSELRTGSARAWISARSSLFVLQPEFLGIDIHFFSWYIERVPAHWFGSSVGGIHEPLLSRHVSHGLRQGIIRQVGRIMRFEKNIVFTEDGQQLDPDLIVFATGYSYSTTHLSELLVYDSNNRPVVRYCESVKASNLFLLGYRFGRTFASPYIRGIARDAAFIAHTIASRRRDPR